MLAHSVALKNLHTFGFEVTAQHYFALQNEADLPKFLAQAGKAAQQKDDVFILGGGSNVVFTRDLPWVLHVKMLGKSVLRETDDAVFVRVAAGEIWDDFVRWSLEQGYFGLENLSAIPGSVGAAPMQNIGAYGREVKDFIDHVEVFFFKTQEKRIFTQENCAFAYRHSLFKTLSEPFLITHVTFKLSKTAHLKLDYQDIQNALAAQHCTQPSAQNLADIVRHIRAKKLPDPKRLGNAGSFFKNPNIRKNDAERIRQNHPNAPIFQDGEQFKISAAWLIDQSGLKGHRQGAAGVHAHHALVLVNHGGADGKAILQLAQFVQNEVYKNFQIHIEAEPVIY